MVNVNSEIFTLLYIARQKEDAPRKNPYKTTRPRQQEARQSTQTLWMDLRLQS